MAHQLLRYSGYEASTAIQTVGFAGLYERTVQTVSRGAGFSGLHFVVDRISKHRLYTNFSGSAFCVYGLCEVRVFHLANERMCLRAIVN